MLLRGRSDFVTLNTYKRSTLTFVAYRHHFALRNISRCQKPRAMQQSPARGAITYTKVQRQLTRLLQIRSSLPGHSQRKKSQGHSGCGTVCSCVTLLYIHSPPLVWWMDCRSVCRMNSSSSFHTQPGSEVVDKHGQERSMWLPAPSMPRSFTGLEARTQALNAGSCCCCAIVVLHPTSQLFLQL